MKRVRFAVIGTNTITDQFIKAAMCNDAFELTAVYSRTEARAREFANTYQVKTIYTSLEELAKSDKVDAVYIASPNAYHAKQAILMMQHQKHVLCEKPLASNLAEVVEMIETAKACGVTFMEAMIPTTLPNFAVIKENLHKIGPVRRYFASFCKYSSRYDAYLAGEVLNAFRPELSNGALVDIGVYTLAPLVALFGKPNSIKAHGYLLASGVDGEGTVSLEYDELLATVMYSKITDSHVPMEIQGELGTLVIDTVQKMTEVKLIKRTGEVEIISVPQTTQLMQYELNEFIAAILAGQRESTSNTWEQSINLMGVLDQVREQIGLIYPADAKHD